MAQAFEWYHRFQQAYHVFCCRKEGFGGPRSCKLSNMSHMNAARLP